MSKELIERLRDCREVYQGLVCCTQAADLIESQAREIAELKLEVANLKTALEDSTDDGESRTEKSKELRAALVEAVDAFEIAVKLNSFREFNDHIPAMKLLLTRCKELLNK